MKNRVEIQKIFSVEDCNNNPNKIYIFGDNLCGVGKGGQAIIRDCVNVFGIPTKRTPSMNVVKPLIQVLCCLILI